MRLLMRRMAPGLVGAGITQLNSRWTCSSAACCPAGSVSLLYYADRVNQLPLGVLGTAVGTALLPLLSRQAAAGDNRAAYDTLNRAIEYALVLTLPAAFRTRHRRRSHHASALRPRAFTHHDASLSAQSLAAYAAGLPAFVLVKVLAPGFFARGDTSTPVKLGMFVLVLNFCLNLALMRPLQHVGPALATTIAAWLNVVLLSTFLRRAGLLAPRPRTRLPPRPHGRRHRADGRSPCSPCATCSCPWGGRHVPALVLAALIAVGMGAYGGLRPGVGRF